MFASWRGFMAYELPSLLYTHMYNFYMWILCAWIFLKQDPVVSGLEFVSIIQYHNNILLYVLLQNSVAYNECFFAFS